MAKLKLQVDALRVESFDTTSASGLDAGTVRAHQDGMVDGEVAITTPQSRDPSCFDTCKLSCWGTCLASCGGTCEVSCDGRCTELCSYGCTDGCTRVATCVTGSPNCCL